MHPTLQKILGLQRQQLIRQGRAYAFLAFGSALLVNIVILLLLPLHSRHEQLQDQGQRNDRKAAQNLESSQNIEVLRKLAKYELESSSRTSALHHELIHRLLIIVYYSLSFLAGLLIYLGFLFLRAKELAASSLQLDEIPERGP